MRFQPTSTSLTLRLCFITLPSACVRVRSILNLFGKRSPKVFNTAWKRLRLLLPNRGSTLECERRPDYATISAELFWMSLFDGLFLWVQPLQIAVRISTNSSSQSSVVRGWSLEVHAHTPYARRANKLVRRYEVVGLPDKHVCAFHNAVYTPWDKSDSEQTMSVTNLRVSKISLMTYKFHTGLAHSLASHRNARIHILKACFSPPQGSSPLFWVPAFFELIIGCAWHTLERKTIQSLKRKSSTYKWSLYFPPSSVMSALSRNFLPAKKKSVHGVVPHEKPWEMSWICQPQPLINLCQLIYWLVRQNVGRDKQRNSKVIFSPRHLGRFFSAYNATKEEGRD